MGSRGDTVKPLLGQFSHSHRWGGYDRERCVPTDEEKRRVRQG